MLQRSNFEISNNVFRESLDHEEENDRLTNLCKEKENEISKLQKTKSGDELYLNKVIHKLRDENESLRENIDKCK